MADIATEFAEVDEADRRAFMAGVTIAYRDVFTALEAAFKDDTGLIGVYVAIERQYQNVEAMVAVEGVLE